MSNFGIGEKFFNYSWGDWGEIFQLIKRYQEKNDICDDVEGFSKGHLGESKDFFSSFT